MILIGTSGYSFPDWVGRFYPPGTQSGDMLGYYAREFPAVEVNATYYRIPPPATMAAMERKTPPDFEFVVKLNQEMTHKRSLEPDLYHAFDKAVSPLRHAGKLSGYLAQFPYAFRRTKENQAHLIEMRRRLSSEPLFVEFRHKSWIAEEIFPWLTAQRLGYVCVDEPNLPGLVPPIARATTDIAYVRFHGRNRANWWRSALTERRDSHESEVRAVSPPPTEIRPLPSSLPSAAAMASLGPLFSGEADAGAEALRERAPLAAGHPGSDRYDYLYSEAELREWVEKIRELASRTKKTLVFFNNCHVGQAATGAKLMRKLLEGPGLL